MAKEGWARLKKVKKERVKGAGSNGRGILKEARCINCKVSDEIRWRNLFVRSFRARGKFKREQGAKKNGKGARINCKKGARGKKFKRAGNKGRNCTSQIK